MSDDRCPKCGAEMVVRCNTTRRSPYPPWIVDRHAVAGPDCLRRQLAATTADRDAAKRELAEANHEYENIVRALPPSGSDDAATRVAELTADRESWIADRDSWLARFEKANNELAALTAERDAASEDTHAANEDHCTCVGPLRRTVKKLTAERDAAVADITVLRGYYDEMKADRDRLAAVVAQAVAAIRALLFRFYGAGEQTHSENQVYKMAQAAIAAAEAAAVKDKA